MGTRACGLEPTSTDLIARTLIKLKTDYKNVASLKTDAVLGNINRIQFGEPWIDQFENAILLWTSRR